MNTKQIQELIAKHQLNKGHNPVCENLSVFFPTHELDVVSVSSAGYVYEFEVKISLADFRKDGAKVRKHSLLVTSSIQMPNYFYYVCPPGLIKGHQIPHYAGLIYVEGNLVEEIVKAPLLHKHKHDLLKLALKISRVTAERHYLGGCKMTVKNNEIKDRAHLNLIEAGFSPIEAKKLFLKI